VEQQGAAVAATARLAQELEKLFADHDRACRVRARPWRPASRSLSAIAIRTPARSRNSPAWLRSRQRAVKPKWGKGEWPVPNSRFMSSPTPPARNRSGRGPTTNRSGPGVLRTTPKCGPRLPGDPGPLRLRQGHEQVDIRVLQRRRSPLWLAITSLSLRETQATQMSLPKEARGQFTALSPGAPGERVARSAGWSR